jgi:hypothetical protein
MPPPITPDPMTAAFLIFLAMVDLLARVGIVYE